MYCGHIGIGLGVKGCRSRIPLYLLLIAAFSCDWVETVCILARLRNTAMLSHSVPAVLLITLLVAGVAWFLCRSWKDALIVGAVSLSHIAVDWITGRKPSWPGGGYWGAHLYRFPTADFAIEATFIVAGWWLYRRSIDAMRRNHPVLVGLLMFLLALQSVFDLKYAS